MRGIGQNRRDEDRQNAKSGREQLGQALNACRGGSWAVFLLSICINLLMLALPMCSLRVYDRILSSRSIDTLLHRLPEILALERRSPIARPTQYQAVPTIARSGIVIQECKTLNALCGGDGHLTK